MNKIRIFILISYFSLFVGNFSCEIEHTETYGFNIENLSKYWDGDFDRQRLFKIRLAFAKTVARAFRDRDFSNYFKNKFGQPQQNHFDELFFGIHKDDVVKTSGTTLYEHLKNSIDPESYAIFGEDFLDLVLRYDPCVVIKLPDVFRFFEWDINQLRPAVIPQMPYMPDPEKILGSNNRFIVYYFTGATETTYDQFEYFHVTIKYSEDYSLIEPNSLVNDKGISFYEFIPQAVSCDDGMRKDILELGRPHAFHKNLIVVRKMDVFNRWQRKCGFKGNYWSMNYCSVSPDCPRNCVLQEESRIVIDSFKVFLGRIFEVQHNYHMDESYTYSWTVWSRLLEPNFIYRVAVPSVPHEYFETRSFQILRKTHIINLPPKIYFRSSETRTGKSFPVFVVLNNNVDPNDVIKYSFDLLIYADRTTQMGIAHYFHEKVAIVNPSEIYHENLGFIEGCTKGHYVQGGQAGFWINW